jgi:hypothetical protein
MPVAAVGIVVAPGPPLGKLAGALPAIGLWLAVVLTVPWDVTIYRDRMQLLYLFGLIRRDLDKQSLTVHILNLKSPLEPVPYGLKLRSKHPILGLGSSGIRTAYLSRVPVISQFDRPSERIVQSLQQNDFAIVQPSDKD